MTVEFKRAVRENVPLLIGLAGGTGSGKTMSALRLAKGLAGGKRFAVVDTENGRALHYADDFEFDHASLKEPFRPERYAEAIKDAAASYSVVVVDSFSHEYAGDGGLLDWHEENLQRLAGDDWKKREAMTFAAWVKPKMAHKRMVSQLLQQPSHLILCLRAEEKIEIVKNPQTGKTEVVPKRTLAGHVGWIPVAEKSFPYELTTSIVLTPDQPGFPKPIKIQEQHKPFLPLDEPISERTGSLLAAWAAGSTVSEGDPQAGTRVDGDDSPARTVSAPATDEAPSPPDVISQPQRKRLYTIATAGEVPDDEVKRIMAELAGVDSSKELPREKYDAVVDAVERWRPQRQLA